MSAPNEKTMAKDDPSHAPESGEPTEVGRIRGQIIEPGDLRPKEQNKDKPARKKPFPQPGK
jgi:hypothetical protein